MKTTLTHLYTYLKHTEQTAVKTRSIITAKWNRLMLILINFLMQMCHS